MAKFESLQLQLGLEPKYYANKSVVRPLCELLWAELLKALPAVSIPLDLPIDLVNHILDILEIQKSITSDTIEAYCMHKTVLNFTRLSPTLNRSFLHPITLNPDCTALQSLLWLHQLPKLTRLDLCLSHVAPYEHIMRDLPALQPLFRKLSHLDLALPPNSTHSMMLAALSELDPGNIQILGLRIHMTIPWAILSKFKKLRRLVLASYNSPNHELEMLDCISGLPSLAQLELYLPGIKRYDPSKFGNFNSSFLGFYGSSVFVRTHHHLDLGCFKLMLHQLPLKLQKMANPTRFLDSFSSPAICTSFLLEALTEHIFDEGIVVWVLETLVSSKIRAQALFKIESAPYLFVRLFKLYSPMESAESIHILRMTASSKQSAKHELQTMVIELIGLVLWRIYKDWTENEYLRKVVDGQLWESLKSFVSLDLRQELAFSIQFSNCSQKASSSTMSPLKLSLLKLVAIIQHTTMNEESLSTLSLHCSHIIVAFVAGPWWSKMSKSEYERHILRPLKLVARDKRFCSRLIDEGFIPEILDVYGSFLPSPSGIQTLAVSENVFKAITTRMTIVKSKKSSASSFAPLPAILAHISAIQVVKWLEQVSCLVYILPFCIETDWYRVISKIVKFHHRSPSFRLCTHLAMSLALSTHCIPFSAVIADAALHCDECRRLFVMDRPVHDSLAIAELDSVLSPMDYFGRLFEESPIHALRLMVPWISSPVLSVSSSVIPLFQKHMPRSTFYRDLDPIRCVRELCERFFENLSLEVDRTPSFALIASNIGLLELVDRIAVPLCDSALAVQYFLDIDIFQFVCDAAFTKGLLPFFFNLLMALSHHYTIFLDILIQKNLTLQVIEHKHVVPTIRCRSRFESCCFYPKRIFGDTIIPERLIQPFRLIGCHLDDAETTKAAQDFPSSLLEALLFFISSIDYLSCDLNLKLAKRATILATRVISISDTFFDVWTHSHWTIPLIERLLASVTSNSWLEDLVQLGRITISASQNDVLPITISQSCTLLNGSL